MFSLFLELYVSYGREYIIFYQVKWVFISATTVSSAMEAVQHYSNQAMSTAVNYLSGGGSRSEQKPAGLTQPPLRPLQIAVQPRQPVTPTSLTSAPDSRPPSYQTADQLPLPVPTLKRQNRRTAGEQTMLQGLAAITGFALLLAL